MNTCYKYDSSGEDSAAPFSNEMGPGRGLLPAALLLMSHGNPLEFETRTDLWDLLFLNPPPPGEG